MRYWLMKTEPDTFNVDDLEAAPRATTSWDGVRNYQARNMLRDEMKRQDQVFLYYSSTKVPGIAAVMEVVNEGYPDKSALDPKDHHYDPESDPAKPRWFMVDVRLKQRLPRIITLEELRKHATKELKGMVLLRPGNRLSVTPVEPSQWKFILSLV
jgi:predicted RNA-binding protein with PUA-like domain